MNWKLTLDTRLSLLLLSGLLGLPGATYAQSALVAKIADNADSTALNALYVDFSAPDLAAPTLLGVNASQVSKPANVRALAGSLLGAAGGFQQAGSGLGLEVAPMQLLGRALRRDALHPNLTTTMKAYLDPVNRIARGTTVSGASITDSTGAKIALGLGMVLIDRTDPLADLSRVASISARLKSAAAIDVLHSSVQAHDQLMGDYARQFVVVDAGLPVSSGSAGERLYNALIEMVVFPAASTNTPAQNRAVLQVKLASWKVEVDKLVPTTLSQPRADKLKVDGGKLTEDALDKYPNYQLAVSNYEAATQKIIKDANEEFAKRLWNATIVQVGAGWTWNSPAKNWNGLRQQSSGVFLRGALRPADSTWRRATSALPRFLYHHVQVVGLVQYNSYSSPVLGLTGLPLDARATTDSLNHKWIVGARLLVGGAWFRVSGEYAMQRYAFTETAQAAAILAKRQLRDDVRTATIGAEVRLAEKLWLEFAFGTTYSASERKDARLLTLANLKYAIRNSQRFKAN